MNIRNATEKDIPLILVLIKELADYEHMLDQVVADEETLREWMFEKNCAKALICEEDGETAGFALYFHNFSTFLGRAGIYLEDLYVRKQFRGRGCGKGLLTRLAAIAVEMGCGRLEWACLNWNESSIGFYKSLGAVPMNEWTVYRLTGDSLRKVAEQNGK